MKKMMFLLPVLISLVMVNAQNYTCVDANNLRILTTQNLTVNNDTYEIQTSDTIYCPSGCENGGCKYNDINILYFFTIPLVLIILGVFVKNSGLVQIGGVFGAMLSMLATVNGFWLDGIYYANTFSRLITLSLFLVFSGLVFYYRYGEKN